jgi:hypothetical protein
MTYPHNQRHSLVGSYPKLVQTATLQPAGIVGDKNIDFLPPRRSTTTPSPPKSGPLQGFRFVPAGGSD